MRGRALFVVFATIMTTTSLAGLEAPAHAGHSIYRPGPMVQGVMFAEFASWLNAERAARGLAPVTLIADTASQTNAETVSTAHGCFHPDVADRSAGTGMTWVGEVASCGAWTAELAVRGFMESDGHRQILLHPAADHIAIGLACHSPGPLATWAVNFYSADAPSPIPPVPPLDPIVTPEGVGLTCSGAGRPLLASVDGARQGFSPVAPVRVLDTRITGTRPGAGGIVEIDLATRVPAGATAVALSLAAVSPAATGHLRVYPSDQPLPGVSSLNYHPGEFARAGFTIVPLGANRRVRIFASAAADVVVDLTGYASVAGHGFGMVGAAPRRVLDTRQGMGLLQPGTTLSVDFNDHGVPADASGVFVTLTATGAAAGTSGHLTAWAAGATRPTASTLNVIGGIDVANMAYVPLSADGRVSFSAGSTPTHLVIDVAAYTAPSASARLLPVPPVRILDTRAPSPYPNSPDYTPPRGPIAPGTPIPLGALPVGTVAVVAGVTSSGSTTAGWMTASGIGQTPGATSTLNVLPGRDVAGFAVVPASNGGIQTVSNASGHHIVDVFGYIVPG